MNDLPDPFHFLPLPEATVHVNDTFRQLRLIPAEKPALYALMMHSVSMPPDFYRDHRKARAWEKVMIDVLCNVRRSVQLSLSYCTPHFDMPANVSEAFLCACTLSALPDGGRAQVHNLAQNVEYGADLLTGAAIYDALRHADQGPMMTGAAYEGLTHASRLLLEMRAARLMAEVLNAVESTAAGGGKQAPSLIFASVARYRPLMGGIDSAMAGYFRRMDTVAQAKLRGGAPGARKDGPDSFGQGLKEGRVVALRPRVDG